MMRHKIPSRPNYGKSTMLYYGASIPLNLVVVLRLPAEYGGIYPAKGRGSFLKVFK
jgi:hypothetical protein